MSRFLRQTTVLALILLWNTAGMYATVCSARCAEADYMQLAATQASLAGPAHGRQVRNDARSSPSRPDPCTANDFQAKNCLTGSSPILQPEFSSAGLVAARLAPLAPGFAMVAGPCTHSPPRLLSGRGLCRKLSLLRI